ncbi:MAG: ROK family protein, partial [Acidimicrobiales bacterium]
MTTVGIDLGGTKTMAVLVDDGAVMARHKRSTPRRGGPGAVLEAVARTVEKVDPHHAADAVGLGVPGPVRPET